MKTRVRLFAIINADGIALCWMARDPVSSCLLGVLWPNTKPVWFGR